ncbi:hypothetical protein B5X24_HaOG205251 [Helicoverpa armigera]|uniref:Uncharacterized protein n=1 Tax=Helicoverpa armigera TaxID=29058 RepID=A0A2W1BTB0_HELAM|nr:hypothetical protein B5X24_HaOG205251 [Helicoverpa armigera]
MSDYISEGKEKILIKFGLQCLKSPNCIHCGPEHRWIRPRWRLRRRRLAADPGPASRNNFRHERSAIEHLHVGHSQNATILAPTHTSHELAELPPANPRSFDSNCTF